jgi:hypothetical protein
VENITWRKNKMQKRGKPNVKENTNHTCKKKRKEKRNQDGCISMTLMDGNLCEKTEWVWIHEKTK